MSYPSSEISDWEWWVVCSMNSNAEDEIPNRVLVLYLYLILVSSAHLTAIMSY